MQADIPGALLDLQRVAERLEELLEWHRLAQQEQRPHVPPAFQLRDHVTDELIGLYSAFLTLSGTTHRALDDPSLSDGHEQAGRWQHELRILERRVAQCRIGERFIRP